MPKPLRLDQGLQNSSIIVQHRVGITNNLIQDTNITPHRFTPYQLFERMIQWASYHANTNPTLIEISDGVLTFGGHWREGLKKPGYMAPSVMIIWLGHLFIEYGQRQAYLAA